MLLPRNLYSVPLFLGVLNPSQIRDREGMRAKSKLSCAEVRGRRSCKAEAKK